jgi:serine/threonine protein kinase
VDFSSNLIDRQIKIFKALRHENLIEYIEYFKFSTDDGDIYYILTAYYEVKLSSIPLTISPCYKARYQVFIAKVYGIKEYLKCIFLFKGGYSRGRNFNQKFFKPTNSTHRYLLLVISTLKRH